VAAGVAVGALLAAVALSDQLDPEFVPRYAAVDLLRPEGVLAPASEIGPSDRGKLRWSGASPLTAHPFAVRSGERLKLVLATDCDRLDVGVELDGRRAGTLEVARRFREYVLDSTVAGGSLTLTPLVPAPCPVHISRLSVANTTGHAGPPLAAWVLPPARPYRPTLTTRGMAAAGGAALFVAVVAVGFRRRREIALAAVPAFALPLLLEVLAAAGRARVVYAPGGYALLAVTPLAAVLAVRFARREGGAVARAVATAGPAVARLLARPWGVPVALTLGVAAFWGASLAGIAGARFGGDPRGFIQSGSRFAHPAAVQAVPQVSESGYDGQFYATLATDPLLRRDETVASLDSAAYRARRIMAPLAAWLLALGSPAAATFTYPLVCWLGGLLAVAVLARWLRQRGEAAWWALVVAASAGFATSTLRATPDAAAAGLTVLALWAWREHRRGLALVALAMACLTRETSLLAAPLLALAAWREGSRRWAAALAAVPVGLVAAWHLLLLQRLGRGVLAAMAGGNNVSFPGAALLRKLQAPADPIEWFAMAGVVLALAAIAALPRQALTSSPAAQLYVAFCALAVLLGPAVWDEAYGHARALLMLPLLALLAVPPDAALWRTWALRAVPIPFAVAGVLMLRIEAAAGGGHPRLLWKLLGWLPV